ncbi:dynamin-related 1E-like [Olea europaea subsp. europaea]|uniref:Dynamin-related 1E-like n=1 Tax=Olea europaea subsp. europaea TaxID=158383 RepID=A0A8S0U0T2_OLEEU|nr:dynamin-related 1E-like [Olea europaea subsp. europaea]
MAGAANEALEIIREKSKKTVMRLVDMESSYLTVDFFRKLPQEVERKWEQPGKFSSCQYHRSHLRGTLQGVCIKCNVLYKYI